MNTFHFSAALGKEINQKKENQSGGHYQEGTEMEAPSEQGTAAKTPGGLARLVHADECGEMWSNFKPPAGDCFVCGRPLRIRPRRHPYCRECVFMMILEHARKHRQAPAANSALANLARSKFKLYPYSLLVLAALGELGPKYEWLCGRLLERGDSISGSAPEQPGTGDSTYLSLKTWFLWANPREGKLKAPRG